MSRVLGKLHTPSAFCLHWACTTCDTLGFGAKGQTPPCGLRRSGTIPPGSLRFSVAESPPPVSRISASTHKTSPLLLRLLCLHQTTYVLLAGVHPVDPPELYWCISRTNRPPTLLLPLSVSPLTHLARAPSFCPLHTPRHRPPAARRCAPAGP